MRGYITQLATAALGAAVACVTSLADTHYVSTNGGHVHPFTNWLHAATNVQSAVDAATSGDSVLVASGHYWLRETITLTNAIALHGVSGTEHTVIDGSNSVRCLTIQSTGATVSGMTVTQGYDPYVGGGGILVEGESTISNCVITGCRAGWGGGVLLQEGGALLSCRIQSNVATVAGGIVCFGAVRLENTLVCANEATVSAGIECTYGSGYGAPEIVNCSVTGNMAEEMAGGLYFNLLDFDPDPIPSPLILNSIIYGNQAAIYPETAEYEGDDRYVDFLACCLNPLPSRYHISNITNDPQLTPSYRLKSTSPCIDAGTSLYAPAIDIDGESRWDHPAHSNTWSIVDIGADEFVDIDADNMADHWETETIGSTTNSDGTADGDSDDLNDLTEYENGTDPGNADTDADQMPDGWETENDLDPLADDADQDPDSDTMNNVGEYVADTDPQDPESVLSILNVAAEYGGIRLDWKGGEDAWQFLECCPALTATTDQWTSHPCRPAAHADDKRHHRSGRDEPDAVLPYPCRTMIMRGMTEHRSNVVHFVDQMVLPLIAICLLRPSIALSDTHFVSPKGAHVSPFLSWQDAATNIQAAVDIAGPGDDVLVTNAVYQLDEQVVVSNGICMSAFPYVGKTVLDAQGRDRCVYLTGSNTSVIGLTLLHGYADYGGGACCEGGSVRYCTIISNTASVGGGLYHSGSGSSPLVDGCTIIANTALCGGGACIGPLSSIAEATNLPENAASAANALESLDTDNLTNMLSQIPSGPETVTYPGVSGSPGRPDMMRVPWGAGSSLSVVRNCQIMENMAAFGGGFFMAGTPDVIVSNCVFAENTAELGGGICALNAGVIAESTLMENEATLFGGGMLMLEAGLMLNCHVISDRSDVAAGGCGLGLFEDFSLSTNIHTCGASTFGADSLRVLGSEFIGNTAEITGGGVMLNAASKASSNTFFRNIAVWGGGVGNWGGEVSESVLIENSASLGGGILATRGKIAGCAAQYNVADGMGGGIAALPVPLGGSLPVDDCRIENNYAHNGGGIALFDAALVRRCTIKSNAAGMAGGGVLAVTGGELQSSLVHDNVAGDGAGVYCFSGGDVVNSTVTANDALNSAGGIFVSPGGGWHYDADTVVANSIVYGNTSSSNANHRDLPPNTTYSHTCTFPSAVGTGNITNPPQLTASCRLGDSSPCLDAGINTFMAADTDLDGLPRPLDGDNDGAATVDMGCYELLNDGADSDGDTMPDGWEFDHGLNLIANDADQDPDADTMDNDGEYVADTDPQDPESVLSILNVAAEHGGIRLDWKGGCDAWQFLECCPDLTATTDQWTAILAVPPPTPMTNAIIDLGATDKALFYRIRAER